MKEKTCCFTGHREIAPSEIAKIKERIKETIETLIGQGIIYYGAGGARGFDTLAAEAVLELKGKYPQIKLILVLPCPDQTRGWREDDIGRYHEIKERADKVVYTADHYFNGCMHVRNRHLVDYSQYCICYLTKDTGGTAFTVNYAKTKGLIIFNVNR